MSKSQLLKAGDRVKGIARHRNKVGTVIKIPFTTGYWIEVFWDGGKRKSIVQRCYVEKIEE